MSEAEGPGNGTIGWIDLTVDNAAEVRDFYAAVVGWRAEPVDMGGYEDFNMMPAAAAEPVAGVCHARGGNAGLPPQWLIYITVEDVDASAAICVEHGGQMVAAPRDLGPAGRYCVIRDPAGAVAALFSRAS